MQFLDRYLVKVSEHWLVAGIILHPCHENVNHYLKKIIIQVYGSTVIHVLGVSPLKVIFAFKDTFHANGTSFLFLFFFLKKETHFSICSY